MATQTPAQLESGQFLDYKVAVRNPTGHPGQMALYGSTRKRIIIRAGRRGGKTTGAGMKAVLGFVAGKRVLYAAPTIDQVQKFWAEVKRSLAEAIEYGILVKNETNHTIERPGGGDDARRQRIRAKTAWNADTLRGDYADLLILDEWQMMDETAWTEVGAPMLIDNNGDVVFIYTPPSLESRSATKARDPLHAAKMYKLRQSDPDWLTIHFRSDENPHISREGLEEVAKNMTEMAYRQEILAEDLEEVPGALWSRAIIASTRHSGRLPEMRRIVVGIDPSGGNTTEVGICVAGEGVDGHYYLLQDASMIAARPKEWAERAIRLYRDYRADRIIAEKNYGGDMVEETLRNVDASVSYHDVTASRGKLVRAEPILALYQRGLMHHAGTFAELEEEMCTYTAKPGQKSPNRMDAMVWCGTELSGAGSLGLLDYLKSGAAAAFLGRPKPTAPAVHKVSQAAPIWGTDPKTETEPAAATVDTTPRCPECSDTSIHLVAGGQMRCQSCAFQWWPNGVPEFPHARRIIVRK